MKIEFGTQPNCSELIIRLGHIDKKAVLKQLIKLDIYQIKVKNFWSFKYKSDVSKKDVDEYNSLVTLIDKDNPNTPDFDNHSHMEVIDDFEGYGDQEIETVISGHEHGHIQMFATLAKIAHHFNQKIEAFDGGSIEPYNSWLEKGCLKVENHNKEFSNRRYRLFKSIDVEVESDEQTDEIDASSEGVSRTFEMPIKKKTKKRTKNARR